AFGQSAAIAAGALAGLVLCRDPNGVGRGAQVPSHAPPVPLSCRTGVLLLAAFAALLVVPPILAPATGSQGLALFDAFYRTGVLVFGGGHVVLPLLQAEVVAPGWVTPDDFLAGYGLVQAVPGPLFTFAAWLGAVMRPEPNGIAGAAIALVAVFLPGILLVTGMLPFWDTLRRKSPAQAAMRGANAAVVGILGAALYSPVFTGAVFAAPDFVVALAGFLLLTVWRVLPLVVVLLLAAAGGLRHTLT
ncbi:MAG: chromate transporter, partial [Pseudomonadota bacterium]